MTLPNPDQDHPRVCGKNHLEPFWDKCMSGSPPRVREKQRWRIVRSSNTGITPACAGKTYRLYQFKQWYWDHPRVCGKNIMETLERNHSVGSPPRVREKLYGICKCLRRCRITPACAGKTAPIAKAWSKLRDHPRVCGKNLESVEFEEKNEGSPPRVREKRR